MSMEKIIKYKKASESEMAAFVMFIYELVVENKATSILEIGVNRGGTSTHTILEAIDALSLADKSYRGMLYSIDIKDFSTTISENNPLRKYWSFVKASSREHYKSFERVVDILLIDGDHSFGGVLSDYDHYLPFVKNGGYILIHDTISSSGVSKFWNSDYIKYPKFEFSWQYGMGIIRKI